MELSKDKMVDIAGELDLGMKCFIHKRTFEVISFPDELMNDEVDPLWQETIDKLEEDADNYIEIERMPSRQAFEVMQDFATQITDNWVRNKLLMALEGKKPLRILIN